MSESPIEAPERKVKRSVKTAPEHKPPDVWCFELGLYQKAKRSKDQSIVLKPAVPDWRHGAAAGLHCWELHEHHAGGPLLLTREDYEAALKAAAEPTKAGAYLPHKPALSQYAPWAPKD